MHGDHFTRYSNSFENSLSNNRIIFLCGLLSSSWGKQCDDGDSLGVDSIVMEMSAAAKLAPVSA